MHRYLFGPVFDCEFTPGYRDIVVIFLIPLPRYTYSGRHDMQFIFVRADHMAHFHPAKLPHRIKIHIVHIDRHSAKQPLLEFGGAGQHVIGIL